MGSKNAVKQRSLRVVFTVVAGVIMLVVLRIVKINSTIGRIDEELINANAFPGQQHVYL